MGGGARALVKQPKTAVFFLRKSPKPGGSASVKGLMTWKVLYFGTIKI